MARKAYGDHATQVNLTNYPDDGTSPVGSAEWNESLDNEGMLGFTPQTSTVTIASGALLVTDSITVVAGQSGAADDLDSITLTNTSEYDLLYLFGNASYDITLKHGDLNANGEISTVSGSDEVLSATKPTILIRKGNYWYGYGGGSASNLTTSSLAAATLVIESEGISGNDNDTTLPTSAAVKDYVDTAILTEDTITELNDTTISGITSGELLKWNGSAWINQTLAEAGIAASGAKLSDFAATTSAELAGTISDETGSGTLVFATSPTLVTPALGTPASGVLTNCTALPAAQVAQGTMASGMILVAPALGTPASGVATNLTGTAASLTAGTVTTNANLTGEVTSSGNTATIADDIIQEGNLQVSNAPTNGHVLTARSGVTGGYTWEAAAGGFVATADDDLNFAGAHDIEDLQRASFEIQLNNFDDAAQIANGAINDDLTGEAQVYVKIIDSNNDGVFARLKKNGSIVNVQLA
jgi:hypothetical protein